MINPGSPSLALEPFFLGPTGQHLCACYHQPAEPARDCGIVICQPVWQEYIRSHRACLNLGYSLAKAGFPSLRFDYAGCGDSAGDTTTADLDQWQHDIRRAITELRQRSGVSTISLVGLRFGASLAAAVATTDPGIASLVLWDPVVSGKQYIEDTTALHQNAIRFFFNRPKQDNTQCPTELVGFAVNPRMLDQIEAINLLASGRKPAQDLLIIESHTGEPARQLAEHFQSFSGRTDYQHIPSFRIWTEHTDKGLVPSNVLSAIVSWLSKVHA